MYNCIVIVGPTACGKTKFSIELSKKINGEIVNADSMQIYKKLNIGTAKVSSEEMENIPHHLFDFVDEKDEYSVSDYKRDALNAIQCIISKSKTPIIVGGTGFYIQSILYDFEYGNAPKNEDIRKKYEDLAKQHGNEFVYNILKKYDLDSANKLHANDLKRVIRAIEIYELTGTKKSEIINTTQAYANSLSPYIIGLNMDRKKLYERINRRVDIMINNGLVDEVKQLVNSGLNLNHQSMNGISYKELFKYLSGESICDCIELIKKNTRNYAKRQLTWFKRMQNIHWLDLTNGIEEKMITDIINDIKKDTN